MEIVENVQTASFGSGHPGPAPPPPATPRRLSTAQSAVLDELLAQEQPVGISRLSELTGLHSNTLREHLDVLVKADLVSRTTTGSHGRGRPSWQYSAVPAPRASQYAELALALAGELSRLAPDAAEAAIRAGQRWGTEQSRKTAGQLDREGNPVDSRVAKIIENLQQLGFAPDYVSDALGGEIEIRLHRCPMLSAAKAHPEITCNVHLGLVRGWLAGADEDGTEGDKPDDSADQLIPGMRAFAASDYCLLTLRRGAV